jgi:hypothetical protein
MGEDRLTRTATRPGDETYSEALATVESELMDEYPVTRVHKVYAVRRGDDRWSVEIVVEVGDL